MGSALAVVRVVPSPAPCRCRCMFLWDKNIQAEYRNHHHGKSNRVDPNDVFFALHAVVLTLITAVQIVLYRRNSPSSLSRLGSWGSAIGWSISILYGLLAWFLKSSPFTVYDWWVPASAVAHACGVVLLCNAAPHSQAVLPERRQVAHHGRQVLPTSVLEFSTKIDGRVEHLERVAGCGCPPCDVAAPLSFPFACLTQDCLGFVPGWCHRLPAAR